MKLYSIYDEEFKAYGQVLEGYELSELFQSLSQLEIPKEGIVYVGAVPSLEACEVFGEFESRGFGGMPIQVGYVGGYNHTLNCLEYHKSSEFNITRDDIILVLGKQTEMENGMYDTTKCKAFFVPAGVGVELYATTLHYAPFHVREDGYRTVCVLPRGTNTEISVSTILTKEDKMRTDKNKWIMVHPESQEAEKEYYIGLTDKNITFADIDWEEHKHE